MVLTILLKINLIVGSTFFKCIPCQFEKSNLFYLYIYFYRLDTSFFLIWTAVLPRQCTRNVSFTFRRVDRIAAVTFSDNIDVDTSVVEAMQKFAPRNVSIAGYELRRADDVILTSFQSVLDHPGDLRYAPQTNLPIGSASDWDEICT